MEGYDVVTIDDHKVGKVVGESGDFLIVEHGTIRKSKHALPREFAHVDEAEQQVRMTVSKEVFSDSPQMDDELDAREVAEYYGLAAAGSTAPGAEGYGETAAGDPARSAEDDELRAGIRPAAEERAEIREHQEDSGLPKESPGLLGDRVAGSKEAER